MSQSAQEKSNLKQVQKSEQKKQEPPIVGVSPNDPIGIDPEETSKPPAPQE